MKIISHQLFGNFLSNFEEVILDAEIHIGIFLKKIETVSEKFRNDIETRF